MPKLTKKQKQERDKKIVGGVLAGLLLIYFGTKKTYREINAIELTENDPDEVLLENPETGEYEVQLYDAMYFVSSEYFKGQDFPDNWQSIANYNSLIIDLDVLRANFGAAVQIVKGYEPDEKYYSTCEAVQITAVNGQNNKLFKVLNSMINQPTAGNMKKGTIHLFPDGVIEYIRTGVYKNLNN
ncbi:hypothetical protein AAH994_06095 [Weeksellaceae bacterium A-14]